MTIVRVRRASTDLARGHDVIVTGLMMHSFVAVSPLGMCLLLAAEAAPSVRLCSGSNPCWVAD